MISSLTPPPPAYWGQEPTKSPIIQNTVGLTMEQYIEGKGAEYDAYIKEWESQVEDQLILEVDKAISLKSRWAMWNDIRILQTAEQEEVFQHYEWAYNKVRSFFGREVLVNEILSAVHTPNRESDRNDNNSLNGVSLCLIGGSGSGQGSSYNLFIQ